MPRAFALIVAAFFCSHVAAQAPPLQTTAEKTAYRETTRHAEVLSFCKQLAKQYPDRVKYIEYGTSGEGRPLPSLVFGSRDVKELLKPLAPPVLLAFANIHAGEVDGKEALLALARDFATEKDDTWRRGWQIVLAPNVNPDGNEKIDAKNRPEQNGPVGGVGIRENAKLLDLNRDFVKLESPEIRALVRLVNQYDPLLTIDCHTTNGSKHRYTLTYDGPRYPVADAGVIDIVRDKMLPAISRELKVKTGYDSFFYGNFSDDRTQWETYPARPRFGVQYFALRNRIGLLSESYSYAPFLDRVKASGQFVRAAFGYTIANGDALRKQLHEAEKPRPRIALRTKTVAHDKPAIVLGYDGEKPKDLSLEIISKVVPTLEVELPFGYLIPPGQTEVMYLLQRHGIRVEELREEIELDLEIATVQEVRRAERAFQKHQLVTLEVVPKKLTRMVPPGTLLVRTGQPLGTLAAYLLEAQSEDGLAAWNAFDATIAKDRDYPIQRVVSKHGIATGAPRPELRKKDLPIDVDFLLSNRAMTSEAIVGQKWSDDGDTFTQLKGKSSWLVNARTGRAVSSTSKEVAAKPKMVDDREFLTAAPGDKHSAFVRKGNLYLLNLETQIESQITNDGGGDILNGRGDWVYEEEIFNRAGRAFWWNADGTAIVFIRFDDTNVKKFTLTEATPAAGRAEVYSYPKPGDPNPTVKLGVATTTNAPVTFLDLGSYEPNDMLIARLGWFPDGKRVYGYVQNRTQTWLDFVVWDSATAKPRVLFRDATKAWIEDAGEPHFLRDGSFLFPSERSGWKHIYHYSADGKIIKAVTSGEWEVKDIHRVDEDAKCIYFSATKEASLKTNLYRATIDGSRIDRITTGIGTHTVSVAPKGDLYIDRESDQDTPVKSVLRTFDGKIIRMLDTNPMYSREEYRFGKYERTTIALSDGFTLEAAIVYPPNFDPSKKYPIWVSTYAGPHAPTIREGWGWRGFEQTLASMGIVSFRVDPRSASGKGAISTWTAYRQLGVQELKDLEAAIDWIGQKPWADATRVGISGHSYGGFITAYALTHSKKFAAGIAGAPVTDWRLYDSIYTERYMGLPSENPKGYDATSCVKAAANLHGKLLLIHGLIDDNVHMQNTMQFADALQMANKPFELMIYPKSRHGIVNPHYTKLQIDFIRRALLDAK